MPQTARSHARRIAFKGTLFTAAFGALHLAGLAYDGLSPRGGVEVLLADDAMIVDHGSRAWGIYTGMKNAGETVSGTTEAQVAAVRDRLLALVDDGTSPVIETAILRGQAEFKEGLWSDTRLLSYTGAILEADGATRSQDMVMALARQEIPPELLTISARVAVTIDASWRSSAWSPVMIPHAEMPMTFEAGGRGEVTLDRTTELNAALSTVAEIYGFLDGFSAEPDPRLHVAASHQPDPTPGL